MSGGQRQRVALARTLWEVGVELSLKDGQEIIAYITREDLARLQLQPAQKVHIKPRKALVSSVT